MKKTSFIFTGILILLLLSLVSCSNIAKEASVSITFNGSDFAARSSRNVTVSQNYEGYYLVVNLTGDYEEAKQIPFNESGKYSVTFSAVPVGANVTVKANVYNLYPDVDYLHILTGESSKTQISDGDNTISLSLKRMDGDVGSAYSINVMSCSVSRIGYETSFRAYSNGKYQIAKETYDDVLETTLIEVLSEGLWTGTFSAGGTIYITECIYKNFRTINPETIEWTTYSIVSEPSKVKAVFVEPTNPTGFGFTSKNGIYYYFHES